MRRDPREEASQTPQSSSARVDDDDGDVAEGVREMLGDPEIMIRSNIYSLSYRRTEDYVAALVGKVTKKQY